ncbi:MAG: hypothetical protein OXI05_00215 [Bacteroidota bacterium]|nr:hypothetical protein [Bacteroidota bacterium]MDE2644250.1 hypothetical protein [Bacteroidota bacterium]
MKQFLYSVSVILAAALLTLVIMGLFVDEVRYTATARVKSPVAKSWVTFLDPDRQILWQRNLERVEAISGQPFDLSGSFRMEFANGRSRLETVTSIIPMEEYRADLETELYSGYRSVTFQALGDGSRIQQTIVMHGSSFVSRAILPVIRPLMQRDQMAAFDNLADLIEASPSIDPQQGYE